MTKSLSLLASCVVAHGLSERKCAWCGAELPTRRRTWCSDKCGDAFWNNHWWSLARRAAKRRDKYKCKRCGHKPLGRTHADYRKMRKTDRLEVNHIERAMGRHREVSCIHHLVNLETLCLACHKIETSAAIRAKRDADSSVGGA